MIGIYLNDNAFEQDIRELLMAFYPGESFVYGVPKAHGGTVDAGADTSASEDEGQALPAAGSAGADAQANGPQPEFAVEGIWNDGRTEFSLTVIHYKSAPFYVFRDLQPEIEEELSRLGEPIKTDPQNRTETKNRIKRRLYVLLMHQTGKQLPWGALTGIRPVKIAMAKLNEGMDEAGVFRFMKSNYFASDEKIRLGIEIAGRERRLLSALDYQDGYSLYVGIPFCPTTCLYCSFTSFPIGKWQGRTQLYLDALYRELDYVAWKKKGCTLDTVYLGGGTPTSLSAGDLDQLFCRLESDFDFSTVKEFTVEAGRPDSITREKLEVLKKHGVSRISINPQTMKQETLDLIGRRHTVDDVKETFAMARGAGFDNINMDLIIGLPGEGLEDVGNTMEAVKALAPDSVTVHSLAIKRAARLNTMKEAYKDLKITNTQEMIGLAADCAREMGLEPYYLYRQKNMAGNFENVGYAAPGKACIYNILIMEEQQTIIGCGAGTATKRVYREENRIGRVENVKNVEQYIERIDEMIGRKGRLL